MGSLRGLAPSMAVCGQENSGRGVQLAGYFRVVVVQHNRNAFLVDSKGKAGKFRLFAVSETLFPVCAKRLFSFSVIAVFRIEALSQPRRSEIVQAKFTLNQVPEICVKGGVA